MIEWYDAAAFTPPTTEDVLICTEDKTGHRNVRIIDLDRDVDEQHPPYFDLPAGVDVPAIGDEITIQEWVPGLGPCGPGLKKTVDGIVRLSEKPARYRLLFKPEAKP